MTVRRLPVQHPQHPHCPACGAALPTYNTAMITFSDEDAHKAKLVGITWHVVCTCGRRVDLGKMAKRLV